MTSSKPDEPIDSDIGPDLLEAVLNNEPGSNSIPGTGQGAGQEQQRRAAVAAVFATGGDDTELLFIERATAADDPWSGQMAFPGGRAKPSDHSSPITAERETAEEVNLDLSLARLLGSLTEVDGGRATKRSIQVAAHCYWLPEPLPPLRPNYEVAQTVWVPVSQLLDTGRYIDYWYPPASAAFPGIQLDNPQQVIWGLTLRFLGDLFRRLDRPFII